MFCQECGGIHKVRFVDEYKMYLCANCIKMYKEHPVNPFPAAGEIMFDEQSRPICHICGRAYNKLMSHVRLKHDLTAVEYKKLFGLNTTKGIISPLTYHGASPVGSRLHLCVHDFTNHFGMTQCF